MRLAALQLHRTARFPAVERQWYVHHLYTLPPRLLYTLHGKAAQTSIADDQHDRAE